MARRGVLLGALLALCCTAPLAAQAQDWHYRWFWGAKGGALGYNLPSFGRVFVGQVGAEWLIMARRTGLYLSYSQSFTEERDTFTVSGANQTVSFDAVRRVQAAVVTLIGNSSLQPYVGAGFALHTLGNPVAVGAGDDIQDSTRQAGSVGVLMVMAGAQLRLGRKGALYGHWQGSPGSRDFLLPGSMHGFEFGLRYAVLPSRADDPTTRR